MPELPDVEIFKRLLDEHARGHVVSRVVVSDPKSLEHVTGATLQRRLKGRRLSSSSRRGKVLFAVFEDAATLAMHFGPNGSLQDVPRDAEAPASTRLLFEFADGNRLAYVNPRRIGHVVMTDDADTFIASEKLGPDALDPCAQRDDVQRGSRSRQAAYQGCVDGSGADRRNRQHLCRRNPVPGTAASRHHHGRARCANAPSSVQCGAAGTAHCDRPWRRSGKLHRPTAKGFPAARASSWRTLPALRFVIVDRQARRPHKLPLPEVPARTQDLSCRLRMG